MRQLHEFIEEDHFVSPNVVKELLKCATTVAMEYAKSRVCALVLLRRCIRDNLVYKDNILLKLNQFTDVIEDMYSLCQESPPIHVRVICQEYAFLVDEFFRTCENEWDTQPMSPFPKKVDFLKKIEV